MTDLFLITGFLGAGKTTFLKRLARLFEGERLSIIVNEFGKVNVDEQLLRELNSSLRGVSGGSIFCACRLEQFEKALVEAIDEGPEVLFVETSGFSDPTAVRAALARTPVFTAIRYRGCVAIADAANLYKLYETANVVKKQLAVSDVAILNKMDRATPEQAERSMAVLEQFLSHNCIFQTVQGEITPPLAACILGLQAELPEGCFLTADLQSRRRAVMIHEDASAERLLQALSELAGHVYRVKGFVALRGEIYQVDGVGEEIAVRPAPGAEADGNCVTILYGSGRSVDRRIAVMMEQYPDVFMPDSDEEKR